MQTKIVQFAPHMAPLASIADIAGLSFASGMFKEKKTPDAVGLTTDKQLQNAIGAASVIPMMDLKKSEHLTEVTTTTTTLIETLNDSKLHDGALVTQLTEHLVAASNELTRNYHQKQNGKTGDAPHLAGTDKPGVHPTAGRGL